MKLFFIGFFGLFAILSLYGIIVVDVKDMTTESAIEIKMWLGFSLSWWLAIVGILTLVDLDTAV